VGTTPKSSQDSLQDKLARLNLHCPQDLIFHLPLRFEDQTTITPVASLQAGSVAQVEGLIREVTPPAGTRRPLSAVLDDGSGPALHLRWFRVYPGLVARLRAGTPVRFFGEVKPGYYGLEMIHPHLYEVTESVSLPTTLTPIYPSTEGLGQPALRKLIHRARQHHPIIEWLPQTLLSRFRLWSLPDALDFLHAPPAQTPRESLELRMHPAWERIKFEELLVQQLSLRMAHERRRRDAAIPFSPAQTLLADFRTGLPFTLTQAQERVLGEIISDMAIAHPMQRLLQGDVGSGKTIVAAMAMLHVVAQGAQAVMMAPTEILAEQHYRKLLGWFEPLGLRLAWISSGRKRAERQADLDALALKECRLAVGTHALLEEGVRLPNLALAVIDEQHRFGVHQRLALRQKNEADVQPHLLMMSATPIPRTLAMSFYADLDVSVIDELPPGRVPIVTKLLPATRREKVMDAIQASVRKGRQAYWVCPLIEESETLDLQNVLETFAFLQKGLPELRIGLLHGRLRNDEKSQTMAAFSQGILDVLVATTVIEVGVDVPNATIMVIEHAERFGLAQLHQLRGRIGRGQGASVCILLYGQPLSENGKARLKAIHTHTDGFAVAREDLAIRGPGEFIGARQSGLPMLRYARLETDETLIEMAREMAGILTRNHPKSIHPILERWPGLAGGLLEA
jgi:ATP-dependent DNA helicase RecG